MFAAERINRIKSLLIEYKRVDVANLSELMSVSEVTVRKDLERLENEGFLTRVYGGAILTEDNIKESIDVEADISNLESKKYIGKIAAQLIQDNEAIFLGPGTTCFQIAKSIKDKSNLTVVTNNVSAAVELADSSGVKVILTGGEMKKGVHTYSLIGSNSVDFIRKIYVDKAFIGISGISFKRGFTALDDDEGLVSSEIRKQTDSLIIVADGSKFDKNSFVQIASLDEIEIIISDDTAPEEYKRYFFNNNIPIYTSYQLDV